MAANRTALSTMLRWESMTPLGLPVVPDVYIRVDRASGSAGQWAGPLARASAVAPGDEPAEGTGQDRPGVPLPLAARKLAKVSVRRSEEHTSELQSRENLVCRLLLEKKKQGERSRGSVPLGRTGP